jgi:hypothetical protein
MSDNDSHLQYRTRAIGRFAQTGTGYNNNTVKETVITETQFQSSIEAQRYLDSINPKYAARSTLIDARRLKHLSQGDDD